MEHSLDFRLAIDVGTIMSSAVAHDPPARTCGAAQSHRQGPGRHRGTAHHRGVGDDLRLLSDRFLFDRVAAIFPARDRQHAHFVLVGRI